MIGAAVQLFCMDFDVSELCQTLVTIAHGKVASALVTFICFICCDAPEVASASFGFLALCARKSHDQYATPFLQRSAAAAVATTMTTPLAATTTMHAVHRWR
jgi:hypothetical protein